MTLIINKSFNLGIVPQFCKKARIVPVFKSGYPVDCKNYRPISVLPALSKIFEKLMSDRMINFITEHNILNDS